MPNETAEESDNGSTESNTATGSKCREYAPLVAKRWLDVIACTALGTLIVYLGWPIVETASGFLRARLEPLPYPLHLGISSVLVALIFWPLHKLGGFRGRLPFPCARPSQSEQWRAECNRIIRMLRFPSLWPFAICAGTILSLLLTEFEWTNIHCTAPIAVGTVLAILFRFSYQYSNTTFFDSGQTQKYATNQYNSVSAWAATEQPLYDIEFDRFDAVPRAKRLAKQLNDGTGSRIALIAGDRGSGKSTLANFTESLLQQNNGSAPFRKTISVTVDLWGVNKARVDEAILACCRNEIARHADALSIAALPQSYAKALGNIPGSWFPSLGALLSGPENASASLDVTNDILRANNSQLLVKLEDLDRCLPTSGWEDMNALVDRLSRLSQFLGILTLSTEEWGQIDRFIGYCESMPQLAHDKVSQQLNSLLDENAEHILESANRREKRYECPLAIFDHSIQRNDSALYSSPLDVMVELLRTPRTLKTVIREFDRYWHNLRGKLDIDDLLALCILHIIAPSVESVILRNAHLLRDYTPTQKVQRSIAFEIEELTYNQENSTRLDTVPPIITKVRNACKSANFSESKSRAVELLVAFLFPLLNDAVSEFYTPLQGVARFEPNSYLLRYQSLDGDFQEYRLTDQEFVALLRGPANSTELQRLASELVKALTQIPAIAADDLDILKRPETRIFARVSQFHSLADRKILRSLREEFSRSTGGASNVDQQLLTQLLRLFDGWIDDAIFINQ